MDPYRAAGTPTRPCPRCSVGLGSRRLLDVSLDECTRCGGVFVPAALMARVVDPLDLGGEILEAFPSGTPAPERAVRYTKCPMCATVMSRRLLAHRSSVVVDECSQHGSWFDEHELRLIADLAERGLLRLTPRPPKLRRRTESRPVAGEAADDESWADFAEGTGPLEALARLLERVTRPRRKE